MKRYLFISFISIVFLLHPKLTEQSINAFRCLEIDDRDDIEYTKVSRMDTNISCYSGTHLKWCILIALPMILIWVVALPVGCMIILFKNMNKENSKVKEYFLILYQGLHPNHFYWEFVNTLRKVLILALFLLETNLQIVFSSMILVITSRIQIYLKPYKQTENNHVEILAMFAG